MNKFMKLAKDAAIDGVSKNHGGPFGAVIVDKNDNIISIGHNMVLSTNDPTAHAEIVAIRDASKKINSHDLSNLILYTSCEPCPMCLSAIIWSNIKEVYFGCNAKDADAIGFRDDIIYDYLKGNNDNLISLKELDRLNCLSVFEEYKKNNKELY